MSGIEVAGLVLGVLPLFISALESYEKGLGPIRSMFSYREELSRYRRKLIVEYALYNQTIEYLLTPIVDDDKLDAMISQGFSDIWKEPALAGKLQKRLGSLHEAYEIVLDDLRSVIEELATMLDIERKGHLSAPHLEALLAAHPPKASISRETQTFVHLYEFKTRLKFSLKSWKIQPLLDKLGRNNEILDRYTTMSSKLEKVQGRRKSSRKSTFAAPLLQIQNSARRLYRVLETVWTCSRHTSHSLNFGLDARLAQSGAKPTRAGESESRVCFCVRSPNSSPSKRWQELEFHVLPEYSTKATQVRFASQAAHVSAVDPNDLEVVDCLCTALQQAQAGEDCLGFCLDHTEKLLGDYPVLRGQRDRGQVGYNSTISLKELLAASSTMSNTQRRRLLNLKQAYTIALHITSSFLQLYSTPFLKSSWSAGDILFLQNEAQPQSINVERPYVSETSSSAGKTQVDLPGDDHGALLRLGILLLEIFFRESVDEHRDPAQSGSNQSYTDLTIARRWVKEDKAEMSKAFYEAVSYCIMSFANPDADLADATFRQEVVDHVVIPLRDEKAALGA
ncbi:hypothetical protein AAFC00_006806 [Neodothiora populina]|uniref:DUF7580 domain-containing protein n=1 Tax=Neodothiora populina TaxID=2781224 RepID=A0ABR3PCF6_9PEZI